MPTKRKDGRLVQSIVDPATGKKKYFYGATKAEINRKIIEYHEQLKIGRRFSIVADEWWKQEATKLETQTIKVYRPAMQRAVNRFGDRVISTISAKDISLYLQDLASKGYASKTVANHRIVVNRVFSHAMLSDGLSYNPCSSVELPKGLKQTKRGTASKEDEQAVIENVDVWVYPFIALMTGMRKGEILALQWRDVDFEKNLISVTKSVAYAGDRPYVKAPKTGAGRRIVPMLPALRDVLISMVGKDSEYIISDNGKSPLTNRRYQTLMRHYQERTGIHSTAHQFRHSFATIAFEENVSPKTVQEILGRKCKKIVKFVKR